jgi:hypothetical protein
MTAVHPTAFKQQVAKKKKELAKQKSTRYATLAGGLITETDEFKYKTQAEWLMYVYCNVSNLDSWLADNSLTDNVCKYKNGVSQMVDSSSRYKYSNVGLAAKSALTLAYSDAVP